VHCAHEEGGVWHAVLGDYDPDVDGWCPPAVSGASSGSVPMRTTQRLCDQQLMVYDDTHLQAAPDCLRCQEVQKLMDEFATKYAEDEDGIDGSNGIEQAGAP
jgi:hypothetical protein